MTEDARLAEFRYENGARGDKWVPETMGAGAAFLDYDGNDRPDILLVAGGTWTPGVRDRSALELFRNEGDGTFSRTTEAAGLEEIRGYGFGLSVADYDNDGDPDVFLTTLAQNHLLENRGGTFTPVTRRAGITGDSVWSTASAFFDADGDGHLDLLVGNYVRWSPEQDVDCTIRDSIRTYCNPVVYDGLPNSFYLSGGDGTFRPRTGAAGFSSVPAKTLGITDPDFDEDGDADLLIANDLDRNLLYRNDGTGRFEELGREAGVALSASGSARGSMGVDAGYVRPSGSPTLFVGNFTQEMTGVFRHQRGVLFRDAAGISRIGQPSLRALTFGLQLFDVDLDGDQDLFTSNGHILPRVAAHTQGVTYRQPVQLFLHRGGGRFELATDVEPFRSDSLVARGTAVADYDRDGDLDVLVTENTGRVHLYRNEVRNRRSAGPDVLQVELVGGAGRPDAEIDSFRSATNRDAIGSRVTVHLDTTSIRRRISGSSSYLSQSTRLITIGLEGRPPIDSLTVRWASGTVRTIRTGIEPDRRIVIREGRGRIETRSLPAPRP